MLRAAWPHGSWTFKHLILMWFIDLVQVFCISMVCLDFVELFLIRVRR